MNILSIDTSGDSSSISSKIGDDLLSFQISHQRKERPDWENFLNQIDIFSNEDIKRFDLLVFGRGPGSYTAIRSSATFLKAISHTNKIPLMAVSNMQSLAYKYFQNNKTSDDISVLLNSDIQDEFFYGKFNFAKNSKNDEQVYRFENGIIPQTLKNWAEDLQSLSKKSLSHLNKLYNGLIESVKDGDTQMYVAEPLLAEAGFMLQRLENLQALWFMYAKTDSEKAAPMARWLQKQEPSKASARQDYLICASPIEVGFTLEDKLWSQCEGAVLCSATLLALNSFDHFRFQAGLKNNDGSQYQQVTSPFDYQNNAQLVVAKMVNEPSATQFTDELIEKLPKYLAQGSASLVLFSSYWQMEKVAETLREKKNIEIQVQGEHSRQHIIEQHKKHCDNDTTSIIFGTQSFSEGLDLPGKYLTNLIITKLPFSVPTSPVEQAQAEYITAKGGNAFMNLSVPETSKKLVQATGRLLRNEKDTGVITLLDKRLISKRYGKQLLNSLPPFKQIIE